MKKALLVIGLVSIMATPAFANSRTNTIMVNLDNVSKRVIDNIKPESDKISSKIDITHLVAFARSWKDKDSRKAQLINLYSNVAHQAFKKFPNSKELHLSAFVNSKKKPLDIGKIIIHRDDLSKIDWKTVNADNIKSNKYIKEVNFLE